MKLTHALLLGPLVMLGACAGPRESASPAVATTRPSATITATPTSTSVAPARPKVKASPKTTPPPRSKASSATAPAKAPSRTHTGRTGHPCIAGERDGDHDGYCGEGR